MKKIITIFVLILLAGLMVYLTKPASTPMDKTITKEAAENTQSTTKLVNPLARLSPEQLASCDTKSLQESLNQLKEQRNQALKALNTEELDPKKLSQLVRAHVHDYQLANEIYSPKAAVVTDESPAQQALKEFQNQKEQMENIFMAALAGQAEQPLNQFLNGELSPLDPSNTSHKAFILNLLSMSGEKQTLLAIDKLYSKGGALSPVVGPAIIQSVNDPKILKQYLSRITDLNGNIGSSGSFFGPMQTKPLIQHALQQSKFEAASVLLELGIKPDNQLDANSLDYFYRADSKGYPLIEQLLNKGFRFSHSAKADRLAKILQKDNPALATRINNISDQLKQQEANQYTELPNEFKQIIDNFKAEHDPLQKQYLECLSNESQQNPKIPPYQIIDKVKIEQTIDQLVAQKVDYQQIIATLGAINKETVEYGYKYLKRLGRENQSDELNMTDMPSEVRTIIGLIHQQNWDELVSFMKSNKLQTSWEITPATLVSAMIEKSAPETAIDEMVKISNKSDIKLLKQALYQPELLARIAQYGFNLNATDQSNKNLFYQAVTRNAAEQIDLLVSHGVSFNSDPYGYDALDAVLRKTRVNSDLLKKLNEVGFPVSEYHLDYSLYLKTYYPERYVKIVKAWPNLEVDGDWESKSL